jgi:dTMP kinase
MQQPRFITIEGGEGAGKTTLIHWLEAYLVENGFQVVTTREPGGVEIAEKIRDILLDRKYTAMDPRTEALLYAAARRQHLIEIVIPALQKGHIVVCDRFIDSSLAYQGHARGLGMEEVLSINAFAIQSYMPDLTLFLDIDPETGMTRIAANQAREVNRLDLEKLEFHHKVRDGYRLLCSMYPKRMIRIDANGTAAETIQQTKQVLWQTIQK